MKKVIMSMAIMLAVLASCSNTGSKANSEQSSENNTQVNMEENNALEILKTRRAIRSFEDSVPAKELIDKVLEAGTYAPTGMGQQSPIIVAITNKEARDKVAELNAKIMGRDGDPFYGAPVVLVVLADKSIPTYIYDGSLVMGNLLNAAKAVGLGSCWIHRAKEVFDSEDGKALLKEWGIEGDYEGIGNCILGYAKDEPQPKPRKENYIYHVD